MSHQPLRTLGVVLCLGLGLALAAPAGPAASAPPPSPQPAARQALERAVDLLAVRAPEAAPATGRDATLALRDLRVGLPRLSGAERRRAEALLARPTDGRHDFFGDGYTVPARRDCGRHVCLHWVTSTRDAPPNRRWVRADQRVLDGVWRTEVGRLGYRRPLADGRRGGSRKLDVYLKEVGRFGLYGYCAPEPRGRSRRAPGYCVLDDDFARSQFPLRPKQSLRVTAAHEFFHAVQFGYDLREDPWFMESTATWMEERYADGVNDNRQYLPRGQFGHPSQPLDSDGFAVYGNWAFVEHLGSRFGLDVVRRAWEQAGSRRTDGRTYSMDAVTRVVPDFASSFADYAMALDTPAESFEEGAAWGDPAGVLTGTLGVDETDRQTVRLDHLASRAFRWRPGTDLTAPGGELRIDVDGPDALAAPVVGVVQVLADGTTDRDPVALDDTGAGQVTVPFDRAATSAVHVVVGNASTRYRCHLGASWSCQGFPRDDRQRFTVDVAVVHTP